MEHLRKGLLEMDVKPYKLPTPFKKLSKPLVNKILKDIEEGSHIKHACLSNGITPRMWNYWYAQGQVDLEYDNEESLPAYVVLSCARVEMKEVKACRQLIRESQDGHKGAMWTLNQAYWREFSPHAPIVEFQERLARMEVDRLDDGKSIEDLKTEIKK